MTRASALLEQSFQAVDWLDDAQVSEDWRTSTAETRKRSLAVAKTILRLSGSFGFAIELPLFEPTAGGGVDLHWKSDALELLLAIPANGATHLKYFGDTPSGETVKGTVDSRFVASFLPLVGFLGTRGEANV